MVRGKNWVEQVPSRADREDIWATHRPVRVAQCVLNLLVGDEGAVFQVVCETESLNIFLQAGGDLLVMPPETIAHQFGAHYSKNGINFFEFFTGTGGGTKGQGMVVGCVFEDDAMKEKYSFLGYVGDISASLVDLITCSRWM